MELRGLDAKLQRMPVELQDLPTGWTCERLDSLARRGSGHTPSKSHPEYWNGDIPWVSLQDSEKLDRVFIDSTTVSITAAGLANSSAVLHSADTVVMTRDAGVGKSAILKRPMAVSQHFMAWACGPLLNNGFLYYWLQSNKLEFERIAMGNTIKTIGLPYFRQLEIPKPPLAEQRDIAEALSDADALIESLSLLLAKKCQIKQGTMQELLTGKKRLPGFSGKWKPKVLGQCASLKARIGWQGLTTKEYLDSGDYYLVTGTELHSGEINWDECHHVDATRYKQDANIQLQIDDVVITKDGTIGKVGIVTTLPKPATLNSGVFVIRPIAREFHPNFFYYLLCSSVFTDFLEQLAAGSTISHLYQKDFVKFVFHLPPTEGEQQAIANVLADMDADITEARLKLAKAHQLKQAMMQELLTGRIRLLQASSNVIPFSIKPDPVNSPPCQSAHNWQTNGAVMIGVLAERFGSKTFPLPRKRRVKLMYLLHRHAEGRAADYLKKAAGPYDPNTKYKGPEAIALKNGYVRVLRNGTYEGLVAGDKIEQAQRYFDQWYGAAALEWLERFHYRKTEDLELLTTVDMAMADLAAVGQPVDVAGVKRVIAANPEWVPKLSRKLFSDDHIVSAIAECKALFS